MSALKPKASASRIDAKAVWSSLSLHPVDRSCSIRVQDWSVTLHFRGLPSRRTRIERKLSCQSRLRATVRPAKTKNENDKDHPGHLRLAIRELDPDQGDEKTKARGRQIGKPLSHDRSRRHEQVCRGGKSARGRSLRRETIPFFRREKPRAKRASTRKVATAAAAP